MGRSTLLGVPNFSEGRDPATLRRLSLAIEEGGEAGTVTLLDVHSDVDHDRSVFTIAGEPEALLGALVRAGRVATERIDVMRGPALDAPTPGQHPHVGALDVAPIVHLDAAARGVACATALALGEELAEELGLPVFLYGELAGDAQTPPRTRAELRRGGPEGLRARIESSVNPLVPDFGPPRMHPRAGATLVAARSPLVAFNVQLAASASMQDARAVAAQIREGGANELPGMRAIAIELAGGAAQVSMNVERPFELPLAEVMAAVTSLAPVASAEIVGLVPRAALHGFPDEIPIAGFDPARQVLENALGCL